MDKIGEIERLQRLREQNALTEEEFQNQKRQILGDSPSQIQQEEPPQSSELQSDEVPSSDETYWEEEQFLDDGPSYLRYLILVCVGLVVAIGAYILWHANEGSSPVEVVVTGTANARDIPSTEDSNVIQQLEEGQLLSGEWVPGATDSNSRWFETSYDGKKIYIWAGNLEEVEGGEEAQDDGSSSENRVAQNLPENGPEFQLSPRYERNLIGPPSLAYSLVNVGKPEILRSININSRPAANCTIWPIFGYDVWEYNAIRHPNAPIKLDERATYGYLYFGRPNPELVSAGIESSPGEHELPIQIGDEIRLDLPSECGEVVTLAVETELGTYTIRFR